MIVKKIEQIRLPDPEHKNLIVFEEGKDWSNNIFNNRLVTKLGICGLPGTTFKITQNDILNETSFTLGNTGLFSLELEDNSYINELYLNKNSYDIIINSGGHYLIIDYLYAVAKEEKE